MPALLLYLLKVNVALMLFYLAYHLILRRLTFYHLNRLFLVFGILFSTLYPFIDLTDMFNRHQALASTYIVTVPAWVIATEIPEHAPVFNYWQIPVFLFWIGTAIMALRLLLQFVSIYKIHAASEPKEHKGIGFRQVKNITQAFSFWQTIYLNPEQHKREELESILRHEQVHIQGWHTLDVLFAELSAVFYWFNPCAWLMKKAIKENLEFIADQEVVNAGVDRKEYQYLLLKVTGIPEPYIAIQFNFPSLKRRIAMINKNQSAKAHLFRFLVVIPIAATLVLSSNSAAQTQSDKAMKDQDIERIVTEERIDKSKEYSELVPNVFIKNNLDLEYVRWTRPNTLTIKPTLGKTETYQLDKEQDLAEASRKYGVYLSSQYENESSSRDTSQIPQQDREQDLPAAYKAFYARNPQVRKIFWKSRNEVVIRLESGEEVYRTDDKRSIAAAEEKYGKLPSSPPPAKVVTEVEFNSSAGILQQQNGEQIVIPEDMDYYQDRDNLPVAYTNFLKRNPGVKKVGWRTHDQQGIQSVILYLNSGGSETYDYNDAMSMATAESKYGKLPDLLPPPPPVMIKQK